MATKAIPTAGSQVYLANLLAVTPVALLIPQLRGLSNLGGGQRKKNDASNFDSGSYDEYIGGRAAPPETQSEIILDMTNTAHQQVKALFEAQAVGSIANNMGFFVGFPDGNGIAPLYQSSGVNAGLLLPPSTTALAAPAAPTVNGATTGGTVAVGTYQVIVTYVTAAGETVGSTASPVTTTTATSTITITSPATATGATGWYAYVTQAGGAAATGTRQQVAGTPTAIGTNLVITAPPTSTGAIAPTTDTTSTWTRSGQYGFCYISNVSGKAADNDLWKLDFKIQVTGKTSWATKGISVGTTY